MNEQHFMGRSSFVWFHGIVEDRQDPLLLGRVRVRAIGWHTDDKGLIPTEELPWANVMQPITSAAMNGLGTTPLGPVPGTNVVGFFRDGESGQEPVIIGTIGGIPEEPANNAIGFYDPRDNPKLVEQLATAPRKIEMREYHRDGTGVTLTPESAAKTYPRTVHPSGAVVGEPDTNRLARNTPDTIQDIKQGTLDGPVRVAFTGSWNEPPSPYDPKYPYNHVEESESGHIRETDDTPNKERTHEWNRSGTFTEIVMDGTKVVKVVGKHYEIVMKDEYIHVMGLKDETIQHDFNLLCQQRLNIEVDGNVNLMVLGSVYQLVAGDVHQTVGGNLDQLILGDVNQTVGGNLKQSVDGNVDQIVGGDLNQGIVGDANVTVEGDLKLGVAGDANITANGDILVKTDGDLDFTVARDVNILAGGNVNIDATQIWWNSGHATPATPSVPASPGTPTLPELPEK